MENAGLTYPANQDDLPSLDFRVEKLIEEIQSNQRQLVAWKNLLQDINRPDVSTQVKPMIRTIELQRDSEPQSKPFSFGTRENS